MNETERKKFNALVEQVENLTLRAEAKEAMYDGINELPEGARAVAEKLAAKADADFEGLRFSESAVSILMLLDGAGIL